jgi:hypothetical protein
MLSGSVSVPLSLPLLSPLFLPLSVTPVQLLTLCLLPEHPVPQYIHTRAKANNYFQQSPVAHLVSAKPSPRV